MKTLLRYFDRKAGDEIIFFFNYSLSHYFHEISMRSYYIKDYIFATFARSIIKPAPLIVASIPERAEISQSATFNFKRDERRVRS